MVVQQEIYYVELTLGTRRGDFGRVDVMEVEQLREVK